MITCGNCKQPHTTVAEVRACYAVPADSGAVRTATATAERSPEPATEKQIAFLRTLAEERGLEAPATKGKAEASAAITTLLAKPKLQQHQPRETTEAARPDSSPQSSVPEGKYAIVEPNGEVVFLQIDRPTEGKWAGWTFTKLLIGSPGDWKELRLQKDKQRLYLGQVAADVPAAAALFGRKFQVCGQCGSPLSQPQSRAAGYGETCAEKHGWYYPSKAEALRMLGESA